MPIISSAKKRVRTAAKAKERNTNVKASFRLSIKKFQAALTTKKNVSSELSSAYASLDQAVKKGILHKNKAARKKSQLAAAAKNAGVVATGAKTAAKPKTVVKKPAAKKPAVKKAAVKKPATKKPAAKKPAAKK